jgi:hypothetical protein
MGHVFISYRRSDSDVVEQLLIALSDKHKCWHDTAIAGGQVWREEITRALDSAYAMILVVSADTEQSKEVYAEYFYALSRKVPIIPLVVSKCDLPFGLESLNGRLWYEDKQVALKNLRSDLEMYQCQTPSLEIASDEQIYLRAMQFGYLIAVENYTPMAGEGRHRVDRVAQTPRSVIMRPQFSFRRASPLFRDRQVVEQKREYEDLLPALHDSKRVVVLGEPGIGKTTTLYKFADELRHQALEKGSGPIPVIIPLREWRDDLSWEGLVSRHLGVLAPRYEQLLERQRLCLLLDGLNELPRDERRENKLDAMRELLGKVSSVVVTCRELDYRDEAVNLDLDTITIHQLNPERVWDFLRRYLVDVLGETDGEAAAEDLFWQIAGSADLKDVWAKWREAGASLSHFFAAPKIPESAIATTSPLDNALWWDAVKTESNLMRLAANPYLLWMFLNVYQKIGTIPSNRGALFDEFVFQLLKREGLCNGDSLSAHGQTLISGLEELAWIMQHQSVELDEWGPELVLTIASEEALQILGGVKELYRAASANLLEYSEPVRFTHQLMQEYFTARRLLTEINLGRLNAQDIWRKEHWWWRSGWEETAVLAVGMTGKEKEQIIEWLAAANPEIALLALDRSGVDFDDKLKLTLREIFLPQMTDLDHHPEAGARAAIGRGLGRVTLKNGEFLDNRLGVGLTQGAIPDISWIYIGRGCVELDGVKGVAQGVNLQMDVPPFRIARYLVTNWQFDAFIKASDGYNNAIWWKGIERVAPALSEWVEANLPRENVSWYEAVAFCRWLTEKYREQGLLKGSQKIRLPKEWEWQQAAMDGNRYNIYPWGQKWDGNLCNWGEGDIYGPSAVGIYPNGTWPNGPLDMIGNVWEWCLNKYEDPTCPQAAEVDISGSDRVLRGGRSDEPRSMTSSVRICGHPGYRNSDVGFRLVQDIQ